MYIESSYLSGAHMRARARIPIPRIVIMIMSHARRDYGDADGKINNEDSRYIRGHVNLRQS